jgi:hypothetical protein
MVQGIRDNSERYGLSLYLHIMKESSWNEFG